MNIIVENLNNGFYRLTPAEGFRLFSIALGRYVSEAVVKPEEQGQFKAVANE